MQKTLLLLASFVLAVSLTAAPAKRIKQTITLPDGTVKTVVLTGDEHMHHYAAADGTLYNQLQDGTFAQISPADLEKRIQRAELRRTTSELRRTSKARRTRSMVNEGHFGKKKGIVILVNFTDTKMQTTSTNAVFNSMLNQVGYNQNGCIGSVHDYFLDQSYGQLDVTFDVVGPFTLAHDMKYYGENDFNNEDIAPATMIIEACKLANSRVNFADYDWNGDGEVDQVYVIYAGYAESQGGKKNTIWPHEWTLSEAKTYGDGTGPLTLDGVKIDTYACSSELNGASGTRIDGIGTTCHEFSHCLGLPDLYDTRPQGNNFGMDSWSLMDYGSYNADGYIPCAYTAYERWYVGWTELTELKDPSTVVQMKPNTDKESTNYIIYNKGYDNEYYILQNIQQESWNQSAGGHGLLIMHIDYNKSIWEANTINNVSSRQRCTIFHADNSAVTITTNPNDIAGDPFPGRHNVTSFSDTTTPAATLYNANTDGNYRMHHTLTEITEKDGLISFLFDGGSQAQATTPVATAATNIGTTSFTANWNIAEGAATYNLQVSVGDDSSMGTTPSKLLSEDFSGFDAITTDGSADISSELDKYMQQEGWTGLKIFAAPNSVKVGSSKTQGYLTTPSFSAPSGVVNVTVKGKAYGTEDATLTVQIGQESQTTTLDGTDHTLTFTDIPSSATTVKFQPTKRGYITKIEITEGGNSDKILNFTGITTNQFYVDKLPVASACTYRVQAVDTAGVPSDWSNRINVTLATEGITSPATTSPDAFSPLYDLQGRPATTASPLIIQQRKVFLKR